MTDFRENPPERGNWFWIIIIVMLFAILFYWFYDPVGKVPVADEVDAPAPIAEFTTAPEGGEQVDVPGIPITAAPVETEAAEAE